MDANKITLLRGPDRIRKRPAVIFSAEGQEGLQTAVGSVLDIFAAEARLGNCTQLQVKQSGAALEIRGNDRGLYLGQDTEDDSVWKRIFCDFCCLPAFAPDESGWSLGLWEDAFAVLYGQTQTDNGLYYPENLCLPDLCAVQCASEYMEVTVVRGGVKSLLCFRKGYPVGGIRSEPSDAPGGTCFRFALDGEVFAENLVEEAFFTRTLERRAMLSPGLCCGYTNTESGLEREFRYPGGIGEFVGEKTPGSALPVYSRSLRARGRERYNRAEYEACVEVAIAWTPNAGEFRCLHNFRSLTYGGEHRRQLEKRICRAFSCALGLPEHIPFEALGRHLTVVLATWCQPHCSVWSSGRRLSIENKLIADMVYDAAEELSGYVYANRDALLASMEAEKITEQL